jgi:phospholipid-binding lipoprotein MlaA
MRSTRSRVPPLLIAGAACAALAGPCRAAADPGDPLEGMNRRFFAVEDALDRHFFEPLAKGFGKTPSAFRSALINFSINLQEPIVFANDVFQGRADQAVHTLARLVVNSTVGLAGLIDVAKENHLPHHNNGFGTTLGRWGVQPGPYLFLPLVGPSTFRDAFGGVADIGLDPLTYTRFPGRTAIAVGTTIVDGLGERVDAQQDLDTIRQTSTDPYATLRSYYLQNRQAEISGKTLNIETLPDFDTPATTPPQPSGPASAAPAPPHSEATPGADQPSPPPDPATEAPAPKSLTP